MTTPEKREELKAHFKKERIEQAHLVKMLGVSQQAVSALLNGKTAFGKKTANTWSEKFGINTSWLLTGEGEMLKDRVDKIPEPAKTPTQLELDFSKIADACQKSANAADESARTARILAEDNSKVLHQLVDSISRIEKKMDVKGAAEDAKNVAKTGGQG